METMQSETIFKQVQEMWGLRIETIFFLGGRIHKDQVSPPPPPKECSLAPLGNNVQGPDDNAQKFSPL